MIVNANLSVQAAAGAGATGAAFISSGGGGGGGGFVAPTATGLIHKLDVEGATRRTAYEAERTRIRKVVIQAFCFDDRMAPHPASQVSPDRDIDDAYDGELYRCVAGTHMQVTIADWRQDISFAGGKTLICHKGEALYHLPGGRDGAGRIECRVQKPARDCNERSLLRRFGAGIKILTLVTTEKYTAWRDESTAAPAPDMSLDGGVGGVEY
ncbi:MAG: hypothetical protein ACYC8V_08010 [Caulobacteraceae bacterium]